MLFHSVAEVNFIFAEDTPSASSSVDGEQKRRRRRARSQTDSSQQTTSTEAINKDSQEALKGESKDVSQFDEGGRKFLTTLGSEDIFGNEVSRAKSKKAYSELAKKKDLYTDDLDVLGPDDTSPVLAESVFGIKGKQRINLIADDIEVKVLMDRLASEFKLNIVSKAVSGRQKMKASLYDLPLETVFQVLLEQANLTYEKRSGIIYLQERGKGQDSFLTERFFKLKEYADFTFANDLITNIATTKGNKIIKNTQKKTIFVSEYQRNLDKIEKVLGELGYLDDIDPDSSTFYYHYLGFNYVDDSVVKDIVDKYKSKDGKASYDAKSNRYLVFDTRGRFEKMKKALAFVDVPRGQVFIDVIFVDLTENDSKRLGMNTTFDWNPNSPDNADQLVTTLATDVTNFFNYKQPTHITSIRATGIKEHSNSNIINNPRLMVLNNEKAVIDVTEKFPYVINENNNGVISSKIQNQDIGVKLDVTPRINANREVQLAVKPTITVLKEVKNIVTSVVDTNQANARVTETSSEFPITDERSIDTQVVVPSGRTLVIGGLIKETDRKSADQIPGLGRLPIFGPLFRRKTSGEEKSQLYIFITPTIVRNAPQSSTYNAVVGDERLAFFPSGQTKSPSRKDGQLVLERSKTGSKKGKIQQLEIVASNSDVATKNDNSLTAKNVDNEKVDFSKFIKKIAALKQKDRATKLQVQERKIVKKRKQKGFENLIDQLQVDIREEAKKYEEALEVKKSDPRIDDSQNLNNSISEPQKVQDMKDKVISDKVVGQRASRIARLLELWEKQPIEGIMTGEDVKREREKERRAAEREKERLRQINEEKREVPTKKSEVTNIEVSKQEESQKVVEPVVEQAITMEALSPLGNLSNKNEKLIRMGDFQTGDIESKVRKKRSKSKKIENKNATEKKVRKRRPRKTSYLRESYELNVSKLHESKLKRGNIVKPSKEVQGLNTPVDSHKRKDSNIKELEKNPKVTAAKNPKSELPSKNDAPTWEKDFFEKDLAKVVFTEIEEAIELEDTSEMFPQNLSSKHLTQEVETNTRKAKKITLAREKIDTEFSSNSKSKKIRPATKFSSKDPRTQQIFENLMSPQNTVKSKHSDVIVSSSDPRTQRIFNELFEIPNKKSKKVTKVRQVKPKPRPAQAKKNHPNQLTNLKKVSDKKTSEQAFESFLDQMFIAEPGTEKNIGSSTKENKNEKKSIKSEKVVKLGPPKAEIELLEFLDNL